MNECKFELKELRCAECRKPTGNMGTCDDFDYCPKCRAEYDYLNRPTASSQLIHSIIEGHKFHPVKRAIHLSSNGKTLCGRKGNHNITGDVSDVTCKQCRESASTIGLG